MAKSDPSPVVRLYLASALQRLPVADRWDILDGLWTHGEDAGDHNLPLMVWYAAEPLAAAEPARALDLAAASPIPGRPAFLVRRIAALGTPECDSPPRRRAGHVGATRVRQGDPRRPERGAQGARQVAMPDGLAARSSPDLARSADAEVRDPGECPGRSPSATLPH